MLPIIGIFMDLSTKASSHPTSNTSESKQGAAGTLGDLNPSEFSSEGQQGLSGTKLVCDVNRIIFLT